MTLSKTQTQTTPTQIRLNARPKGMTNASTWLITQDAPPALEDGDLRVSVEYISVDPATVSYTHLTLPTKRIV